MMGSCPQYFILGKGPINESDLITILSKKEKLTEDKAKK